MKAVLPNDTQSHAVSLESSATPLRDTLISQVTSYASYCIYGAICCIRTDTTCKKRHDFQRLAPVIQQTLISCWPQKTLTAMCLGPQKCYKKTVRRILLWSFRIFYGICYPCKKAPCVETATVCLSATHNRSSIFMKCCVGFMCYKCRECVGLVQISSVRHILVKGIKEFPPVLSLFVVICSCETREIQTKSITTQDGLRRLVLQLCCK